MEFSKYIKYLRDTRNLSQRELAKMAGISNTEIWRIEKGDRSKPSPKVLEKLAAPLGVSYEHLMEKAGYITPSSGESWNSIINDIEEAINNNSFDQIINIIADEYSITFKEAKNKIRLAIEHFHEMPEDLQIKIISLLAHKNKTEKGEIISCKFNNPNELEIQEIPNAYEINKNNIRLVPVLGKVAAGQPIYADENIEDYYPVDISMLRIYDNDLSNYFYLRIHGNSMEPLINDGDLVLVRKGPAENGDIAVVLCEEEEACVKKIQYAPGGDILILISRNPDYSPIVKPLSECKILGKVIWRAGSLKW